MAQNMNRSQNGVNRPSDPSPESTAGYVLDLGVVSPRPVLTEGSQAAADGGQYPLGRGGTNVPMPDNKGPRTNGGDQGLGVM